MSKIFVYSGEDIISSRKAFLEHLESLKKDNLLVEKVEGKSLNSELLENLLGSTTLFGEKKVLAVDNFLSQPKAKDKEEILEKILSFENGLVLFWENKDFSRTNQQKYPKEFIFKNFKLPSVLFKFLDSLAPGQTESSLKLYQQTIGQTDASFVFLMMVRQLRLLLLAKDKKDLLKLASWQKAKLKKQAAFFKEEQLIKTYEKLLKIDFQQKTSSTPYSLEHQLELLLLEI